MKRKIVLLGIFLALSLMGCNNPQNPTPVSDENIISEKSKSILMDKNFHENFNKISIGEKEIEIPFKYEELNSLGYVSTAAANMEVIKGKPIKEIVKNSSGTEIEVYAGYHGTEDKGYKKDLDIISVMITQENAGDSNISFYGDIDFNSTREAVGKTLELVSEEGNMALYTLRISKYSYLAVSFDGKRIKDIMVINGENYF